MRLHTKYQFLGYENTSEKYGWDYTTDRNLRVLGVLSAGDKDECVTFIIDITSKNCQGCLKLSMENAKE